MRRCSFRVGVYLVVLILYHNVLKAVNAFFFFVTTKLLIFLCRVGSDAPRPDVWIKRAKVFM